MNAPPLYTSKRTLKSLGQEYRIYPDRLELQCWLFLFHPIIIPVGEVQAVEVRPSVFGGLKGVTMGIKLDFCDLCRHVLLKRKHGLFRSIGFSPDEPGRFVEHCRSIMGGRTGGDAVQ
jgi:hypothetical protein